MKRPIVIGLWTWEKDTKGSELQIMMQGPAATRTVAYPNSFDM
jgi:hypothetical protein